MIRLAAIMLLLPAVTHGQRLSESFTSRPVAHFDGPHAAPSWDGLGAALDSAQRTKGHALTGLAIGAAAGVAAAFILFAPGSNACSGSGDYEQNCKYYRAAIVVGSAGLGALIGALVRTEAS